MYPLIPWEMIGDSVGSTKQLWESLVYAKESRIEIRVTPNKYNESEYRVFLAVI